MIKVTIGNSFSQISGLTVEQFKGLRDILCYTESKRGFKGFQQVKRYLISRRGEFPSGLLHLASKFLVDKRIPYTLQDTRKRPQPAPGMFSLRGVLS